MTRVGIVGGAGRMGQIMARELSRHDEISVVVLVDLHEPASAQGVRWVRALDELSVDDVDVLVDFSVPDVTRDALRWCLANDVALVSGTTGLSSDEIAEWEPRVVAVNGHVLYASNFSIGAVLADRFAAQAAKYFDQVEIIELHHERKIDAPSGTSLVTARVIADARRDAAMAAQVDPTQHETLVNARGAQGPEGIRIHSVRLAGLVAHQEVIFGGPGEGLTIRHDSYDRVSFISGVAVAVRAVRARPGLTVGLHELV